LIKKPTTKFEDDEYKKREKEIINKENVDDVILEEELIDDPTKHEEEIEKKILI